LTGWEQFDEFVHGHLLKITDGVTAIRKLFRHYLITSGNLFDIS